MQCAYCHKEFEPGKYQKTRKFCSRSCNTANRNKTCTIKESWKRKYGDAWEQRYEEWRIKMSEVTSGEKNPMHGRHHTDDACQRIAIRTRGKTLEEIYGIEIAADMKRKMSEAQSGDRNPAYGKVYANGGKSIKGHYKGFFFRSLFEYSFMKHLESRGISLQDDVDYECFVIPYTINDRQRTYRIDFFVKSENVAYEVKPAYVLKNPSSQQPKWDAARELLAQRGIEFRVVTEHDFEKIVFDVARQDPNIIWKEETLKYFRSKK